MSAATLPEIELGAHSRLIADLHLDAEDPESCEGFIDWLVALPPTPVLGILGDLFDVWVGPSHARAPAARVVLDALASRRNAGTRLVVVPGNRDFLLDRTFESACGAELFEEGFVGRIARGASTARALCVHGDTLCTRDHAYQRLRRVLRSGAVRWIAPHLPFWIGRAAAKRLRRASVRALAVKLSEEKALQETAVRSEAERTRADVVICGHAHAFRDVELDGGPRWIVLDAFGGERSVLCVGERGELVCEDAAASTAEPLART